MIHLSQAAKTLVCPILRGKDKEWSHLQPSWETCLNIPPKNNYDPAQNCVIDPYV